MYEGDQRHVEIASKALGFNERTRSVVVPSERSKLEEGREKILDQKESTKYRGLVARLDIHFAVKELGSAMANPTRLDLVKLERCIRYLLGVPRCIVPF